MKIGNSITRWLALAVAITAVATMAGMQLGCAKTQAMRSSDGSPASQGTVRATDGDNGNTNLNVSVKHLAPPSKMASDATVYVVWVQPRNGAQQSVGALTLNDNLEGSLDTVTPHRSFTVSVTPEPNGAVAYPTNDPVFTSDIERPE